MTTITQKLSAQFQKDYAEDLHRSYCDDVPGSFGDHHAEALETAVSSLLCRLYDNGWAAPLKKSDVEFSEGICGDGAAILRDGVPLKVAEILDLLRRGALEGVA